MTRSIITQFSRLKTACNLCNVIHNGGLAVCSDCIACLSLLGSQTCARCAFPLTQADICGQCIQNKPIYDAVRCVYRYEGGVRQLIQQFKYREHIHLAYFFCSRMLQLFSPKQDSNYVMVPIPMRSIQKRGFNQSALLTRLIATKLKIPFILNLVKKIKATPSQSQLNLKERKTNLGQCFQIKTKPPSHVILIDDVLTTGQTANQVSSVLKQYGTQKVKIWTIARAI